MRRALFIFRRDLRIEDNTGLNFALEHAERVIPCFIFTPEQIEHNPYRSDRCLQFMLESLQDLAEALKQRAGRLYLFYGHPDKVVETCIKTLKVDGVVVNRDYTPYSCSRDQALEKVCSHSQVPFYACEDALLHAPEDMLKADGTPYTVFTPFYKKVSQLSVRTPHTCSRGQFEQGSFASAKNEDFYNTLLPRRAAQARGGRTEALKILKNLKSFLKYPLERDYPALEATTHLSAHLKFTTCSPREVYHAVASSLGKFSEIIRSLYWRDFFTLIALYFPYVFGQPFHTKFAHLPWKQDPQWFELWCQGMTGFPIVDAGMRQLRATGYMHNRVRMIVASFLVKDMHIDWLWGEKYFAQTLIDYDPAVNNGNWQWAASTGCDAQPYFRIFNPWLQQKKFDADCIYIKHWIPELGDIEPKHIHHWYQACHSMPSCSYPAPILQHEVESKNTLNLYKTHARTV